MWPTFEKSQSESKIASQFVGFAFMLQSKHKYKQFRAAKEKKERFQCFDSMHCRVIKKIMLNFIFSTHNTGCKRRCTSEMDSKKKKRDPDDFFPLSPYYILPFNHNARIADRKFQYLNYNFIYAVKLSIATNVKRRSTSKKRGKKLFLLFFAILRFMVWNYCTFFFY